MNDTRTALDLDEMLDGYLECALWAEGYDDDYDADDLDDDDIAAMRADVEDFALDADLADAWAEYARRMGGVLGGQWTPSAQAGHDFWLTRNGHGAGFWDRGLGKLGDRLTAAAKVYGEAALYVGDDGTLHAVT